ncbi:MAG: PIG-L family deacetylase, partial [Flavobacteriales bacterium]
MKKYIHLIVITTFFLFTACSKNEKNVSEKGASKTIKEGNFFAIKDYRGIPTMTSSEILNELQRANTVGRALYVAAHPDDENTSLIAYLANEKNLRTGYLSLTRGDGGQNRIGPEKGELMGMIRTQELLEARNHDGGEQFFTRAIDFGYSKTATESFNIWGKKKVLSDVVRVIRKFRPDVIITRFPMSGYEGGHGHHTASGILAKEAFEKANDPEAFPDQIKEGLKPWQPKRLLFNTSTWWNEDLDSLANETDTIITEDVGKFNPLLGKSYREIAAISRTNHKSQGFGAPIKRGKEKEYLLHKGGKEVKKHILNGIDVSWDKINGGNKVKQYLDKAINNFDESDPSKILPELLNAYKAAKDLDHAYWRKQKSQQIKKVIVACAGLYLEATAQRFKASPGDTITFQCNVINRSHHPFTLKNIKIPGKDTSINKELENNVKNEVPIKTQLSENLNYSYPYWLKKKHGSSIYKIKDPSKNGMAETLGNMTANILIESSGQQIPFEIPIEYKWTDRVEGQKRRRFVIVPEVTLSFDNKVYIFPNKGSKKVKMTVKSHKNNVSGKAGIDLPKGWNSTPSTQSFNIKKTGEEKDLVFTVTPGKSSTGKFKTKGYAKLTNGNTVKKSLKTIEYSHIRPLTRLKPSVTNLINLDLKKKRKNIGYIMGAGDEVPQALKQVGYRVNMIDPLNPGDLQRFDAIVVGIRAYNTVDAMRSLNDDLLEYVKNGGHMVVQYSKSYGMVIKDFAPYKLKLSHDRVTEEHAKAKFLASDPGVLKGPNKITRKDMKGWVQERGLYFANEWSDKFKPVISWHDK